MQAILVQQIRNLNSVGISVNVTDKFLGPLLLWVVRKYIYYTLSHREELDIDPLQGCKWNIGCPSEVYRWIFQPGEFGLYQTTRIDPTVNW